MLTARRVSQLSLSCLRQSLLFLCLLLYAAQCRAQQWTLPLFTSDPHSVLADANRYRVSEDLPSLLIDYSADITIDEAGKVSKTTRMVRKIFRLSAVPSVQSLTLRWSAARENKPIVKGRVITSDGQAHVLDETGILEKDPSDEDATGASKLLRVRLPSVDIDSVVELEVQQSEKEPTLPGGHFGSVDVPPLLPIVNYRVTVTSLGSSDLHVETRSFLNAKTSPLTVAKGHAFSVEASKFVAQPLGQELPPDVAPYPMVVFSDVPSWQAVARWYAGILDKAAPHEVKPQAGPAMDRLATAEKLWEEVRQQVHENGLDLGGADLTPRTPAEILKARTGDALDQALVLMDKLAAAGLSSKIALIERAPQPDVLQTLPGFEAFNHVLVYVDGPTPIWIDPGADYASVAHLPIADQNRLALIVDPQTTQLTRTPASTENDNVESVQTEIRLGDGNPTKMSHVIQASGSFADSLLPILTQLAEPDADQNRIAMPVFRGGGGQRIQSVKPSSPHQAHENSRLEITGEGYAGAAISDEGGLVELPGATQLNFHSLSPLLAMNRDDPTQPLASHRTVDYYIAPPFVAENRYHIIPPPGYRIKETPVLTAVTIGPMTIAPKTALEKDGSLRVSWTMTQPKTQMTPQQVEAMRSDYRNLAAKDRSVAVALENIAEAKLQSGDYSEALTLLKKDAEAEKDTINPSLRLASGYVSVGGRVAAVKLCEDLLKPKAAANDASEPSPDSKQAAIYDRLGWIYEHDEYGRMFAPGMDAAKAEENFRHAASQGYGAAGLSLAELYTYNPVGIRFGRGARLDNALAILNRVDLNTISRTGRLNEYALLLLRDHKYQQLYDFFSYPQADHADQSLKWAAFAMLRSDSDLKLELDLSSLSPNDKHTLLVEAGRHLVATREYATAARVFRFAGKGPGVSQVDVDRLSRLKPFDEGAVSSQPAVAAFQRYVQAILNADSVDGWKKLATAANQKDTLEAQRLAILQFFSPLTGGVPAPDLWPFTADLIDSTLSFTVDGGESTGFRVKASIAAGTPVPVAYVVKQDKDYLVAGVGHTDAPIVQAVASARAGNTAAAREWLNWAREQAGRPAISDADFQHAIDLATGEQLISQGKAEEAAAVLLKLHTQDPSNLNATYFLVESLTQSNRAAEAKTYIDALPATDVGTMDAMRLRARLAAQQKNFAEAVAIEKQICAKPNALLLDWNDLAWMSLFVPQNVADAQTTAEKAAQMSKSANAAVLHTLALAQASNGNIKDAIATANKISVVSGDPGEMETIFGRIAEDLSLLDVARQHYSSVPKDSESALSNYSYAQMRLSGLKSASAQIDAPAKDNRK